jgi:hypothetical protein
LHAVYTKDIPEYLLKIADMYEGKMSNRIGLNFPMDIVVKYIKECVKDIKDCFLKKYVDKIKYVIVYKKGDKDTKEHELMHAKYYIDTEYKKRIDEMWYNMSEKSKTRVIEMLKRMGYNVNCMSIVIDEFQAYYYTESDNFFGKNLI